MREIAETRVKMRNAAMTMKRLKFNILPTLCTMMVVGHFPCLERLLVCVYAMTQDIASASDFGNYSEYYVYQGDNIGITSLTCMV